MQLNPPASAAGRGGITVQVFSRGKGRPHTEQKVAPRIDTNYSSPRKLAEVLVLPHISGVYEFRPAIHVLGKFLVADQLFAPTPTEASCTVNLSVVRPPVPTLAEPLAIPFEL